MAQKVQGRLCASGRCSSGSLYYIFYYLFVNRLITESAHRTPLIHHFKEISADRKRLVLLRFLPGDKDGA
ncbi:MAG: hypothetical protein U5K51_07965 [Flavobacteriaceae bacterium]|nr:hypothetical protein [Flavobacteriaceae bacterium]